MVRNKVLIIEDEDPHYQDIKNKIIPQDMFSLFDVNGSSVGSLSEEEKKAVAKFHSTESGALRKSMDFIVDTINKHYQELGLIICDLQINGDDNAGSRIIEMIRNNQGLYFDKPWYGKEIPIVIVSKLVDKEKLEAYERASNNCFFLSKTTAFSNEGSAILNRILHRLAEQFDEKFEKSDSIKQYKVALSFTGSNLDADGKEFKIRGFVHAIADELSKYYTTDRVFFDMNQQDEANAKDKDLFVRTYNKAEYVVVFISEGYKNKTSRWSAAEWEVIKKLNLPKQVIFVAIDSTLKDSEFQTDLDINEVIYKDMLALCSDYNQMLSVCDVETIGWIKDNVTTKSITVMASHALSHYKDKASKIIAEAAGFIVKTINKREIRL